MSITREQFSARYAADSHTTVELLKAWGREARPCDCGEVGCDGWQMAHIALELEDGNDWPEDSPHPLRHQAPA